MKIVSVLCCSRSSVYHTLQSVSVYDKRRDARSFHGGTPIVAHPPCRAWSAKLKHQAKPEPGEMELGLWCCDQLKKCGGVLEQPAHSGLFSAAGFPIPGVRQTGIVWSLEVWQSWFGYPIKKATWLAFVGVSSHQINIPFRLHSRGNDGRVFSRMSKNQRSATNREFAEWLLDCARKVNA